MGDRVLIVEDEARLREILCDYFSAKGEQPVGAENGQAALDYLRDHTVDAVLLDILMPELDGFTVCRAVRKQSSVPIIFLTALSDEDDKLRGYELGADDYVTKPYSMAVLYAKTKALIARCRGCIGANGQLEASGVTLNLHTHRATIAGTEQELPGIFTPALSHGESGAGIVPGAAAHKGLGLRLRGRRENRGHPHQKAPGPGRAH